MQRSPMRPGSRSILRSKGMIAWRRCKAEREIAGFRGTTAGQVLSQKTSFFSGAYASRARVRFPPPPQKRICLSGSLSPGSIM